MRLLLLSILLVLSTTCLADTYLRLNGLSMHSTAGNNALNYGLGLEHDINEDWAIGAGWYRNSEWHGSGYAMARYTFYKDDMWNIGVGVGAVTGYKTMSPLPMVMPDVCYGVLCGLFVPKLEATGSNVLGFSVRLPIE